MEAVSIPIRHPTSLPPLSVCQSGEEACTPSHAFGPALRDHYLIHFVLHGQGMLHCTQGDFAIRKGQGFLILPGEETFYQADEHAPWHYIWVGYRGEAAEQLTRSAGLSADARVFTVQDVSAVTDALRQIREDVRTLRLGQLAAVGGLLRFMALIAPLQDAEATLSEGYCDKALWYLEGCYERNVSIQETADFVGLSRSQLYRVMMAGCGCSPKEMLSRIRLRHAAQMLTATTLTLEEIAHRVGLQTGAQLGVSFKAVYGVTPGTFRHQTSAEGQD